MNTEVAEKLRNLGAAGAADAVKKLPFPIRGPSHLASLGIWPPTIAHAAVPESSASHSRAQWAGWAASNFAEVAPNEPVDTTCSRKPEAAPRTSSRVSAENFASQPTKRGVPPFRVGVIVDSRERRKDELLAAVGSTATVRMLPIGDMIFVRERDGEYHVLPVVIERKQETDLAASVIDQRYRFQKAAMNHVFPRLQQGRPHRAVYLFEKSTTQMDDVRARRVLAAASSTGLRDRFSVIRAQNGSQAGSWLAGFIRAIERSGLALQAHSIPLEKWMEEVNAVRMRIDQGTFLPRALRTARGVGHEMALEISRRHRTVAELVQSVLERHDSGGDLAADGYLAAFSSRRSAGAAVCLRCVLVSNSY